ncbi:MAG: hypothetical protein EU530_03765 [Promethearchaeota archaeon]|nr:MAG: hypothetical protein EU530_03765 [Candidatus Lokiarchaeota archaeon]
MMFYGNEYRKMTGVIRDISKQLVKVEFTKIQVKDNTVFVPKNIIKGKVEFEQGIEQDFQLPSWFLRRNKLVP